MARTGRWWVISCAMAILAGCAGPKPPPPLLAPAATVVSVSHFLGTPLSGASSRVPQTVRPEAALGVDVAFVALERLPEGIDPIGARARLILATHGDNPVRSTGHITRDAVYAVGADAEKLVKLIDSGKCGRIVMVGQSDGVLTLGATARFEATDSEKTEIPIPSGLGHRRFQVRIGWPAPIAVAATSPTTEPSADAAEPAPATEPTTAPSTQPAATTLATAPATGPTSAPASVPATVPLDVAIELDDLAATEPAIGAEKPSASSAMTLHIETVLLDPLLLNSLPASDKHATAVIAVPFKFRDGQNQAVAAIVRVHRLAPHDPAAIRLCQAATLDMHRAYVAAQFDAAARPAASPDASTLYGSLSAMVHPQTRRSAIVYLASWSSALICEDFALNCDDKLLAELADELSIRVGEAPPDRVAVGWRMDKIALELLLKLQADGKLPPELAAVLCDRAGEAGRHPSAMEDIMVALHGPEELDQRLVATNRQFLEDSSPASRARAYDWLKNRNRHEEPADFHVLGSFEQRRMALEKDALLRAAAATQPAATEPSADLSGGAK